MVTQFWPDYRWLPEIMPVGNRATEVFSPSWWLLWHATTKVQVLQVRREIKLTVGGSCHYLHQKLYHRRDHKESH